MTTVPLLDPTVATPIATTWTIVLLGLTAAYLALLVVAFVGMFRRDRATHAPPERRTLPSVSVIVPAHDEARVLPTLLASLRAQRYDGDLEFVVVDDRSRDGTGTLLAQAARSDARVRPVRIDEPDRRRAPKVNAVAHGIEASRGEIVLTTDADCVHRPGWVAAMVRHLEPDGTVVVGYVETTRAGETTSLLHRFETIDWLSLMLVSRSLTRFGWRFASSANNQGYRRSAFDAAGGFGAIQRAPSGDEDLLVQRLGRLPGATIAFASEPNARVRTASTDGWRNLFLQRRRWVSRYHHAMHYRPAFLASIGVLGFQSVALATSVVLLPVLPQMAPWVAAAFGAQLTVQLAGMTVGARDLDRADLLGPSLLAWALLHPFFVASVVIGSFVRSGEWRAGAASYRRRWWRRRRRTWRRAP
ncbi:MAG: glycosyltransferase, partial [Trueperaceae bacterium]